MKKIKVLMLAVLATGFFAMSCSSDDKEDPTGGDLTAKWNQTKTVTKVSGETLTDNYDDNQVGCDKDYLEFTDDSHVTFVVYNMNADGDCEQSTASNLSTWARNENTLMIAGTNPNYSGTYEIIRLTGSELQLRTENTTGGTTTTTSIYFNKAANQ
jgi:hypothetical protein